MLRGDKYFILLRYFLGGDPRRVRSEILVLQGLTPAAKISYIMWVLGGRALLQYFAYVWSERDVSVTHGYSLLTHL